MNGHDLTRRDFLKICGITAAASAIGPVTRCHAAGKPLLRFAVASDIHYGQKKTPFAETTERLVSWMNDERKRKGLDAVFLNGDLFLPEHTWSNNPERRREADIPEAVTYRPKWRIALD
ncbi:MAG: twin-arginine translocation signal domain-containing protein, partial [Planctomycetota bacterium]